MVKNCIKFKQVYNNSRFESFACYDKNGKKIYLKKSNFHKNYEYDKAGRRIYEKDSLGNQKWFKYDRKGRQVYRKVIDSGIDGGCAFEFFSEYDSHGNIAKTVSPTLTTVYTYFNDGKLKCSKNSDGIENYYRYDENGNQVYHKVHLKHFNEKDTEFFYDFDEQNRKIYGKEISNGKILSEEWFSYDSSDNLTEYKRSDGTSVVNQYDSANNLIHEVKTISLKDGAFFKNEKWWKFDENGNEVFYRDSYNNIRISVYTYYSQEELLDKDSKMEISQNDADVLLESLLSSKKKRKSFIKESALDFGM